MYIDAPMFVLICADDSVHSFEGYFEPNGRRDAERHARQFADHASCGPHRVGVVLIDDIRPVGRPETDAQRDEYRANIGKVVVKKSGKPFKSTKKEATIKGITTSEHTGLTCYTFIEDDSYVECFRCVVKI